MGIEERTRTLTTFLHNDANANTLICSLTRASLVVMGPEHVANLIGSVETEPEHISEGTDCHVAVASLGYLWGIESVRRFPLYHIGSDYNVNSSPVYHDLLSGWQLYPTR